MDKDAAAQSSAAAQEDDDPNSLIKIDDTNEKSPFLQQVDEKPSASLAITPSSSVAATPSPSVLSPRRFTIVKVEEEGKHLENERVDEEDEEEEANPPPQRLVSKRRVEKPKPKQMKVEPVKREKRYGRLHKVLGPCSLMKFSVIILFLVIVIGVSSIHLLLKRARSGGSVELHSDTLGFSLAKPRVAVRFSRPSHEFSIDCLDPTRHPHAELCRRWGSSARLQVERMLPPARDRPIFNDPVCHRVRMGTIGGRAVTNCIDLGTARWYGGHESLSQQRWPINSMKYDGAPFVSGLVDPWGAVQERYWISSDGLGIFFDDSQPLFYSLNQSMICFTADSNKWPYDQTPGAPSVLEYTICGATDIRAMHIYALENWIPHPKDVPDMLMMRRPIWSTWVSYGKSVTQQNVTDFAKLIQAYNFTASQIEIDDKWESGYGDMQFNNVTFPDPRGMVSQLHDLGFRVTLWVHPFVNLDTDTFREHYRDPIWVKTKDELPAVTSWWNGLGLAVDFTNEKGMAWQKERLRNLTAMGIDGFKFDAGEAQFLPHEYELDDPDGTPNTYAKQYALLAESLGALPTEIRVGAHNQQTPLLVRMLDRSTSWSENNGLRSIIPATLTFGILGYPFVLPDMIAGNGDSLKLKLTPLKVEREEIEKELDEEKEKTEESHDRYWFQDRDKEEREKERERERGDDDDDDDDFGDDIEEIEKQIELKDELTPELFIRWVELTAFLPAMQFSIPPWMFDNKTVATCLTYVWLHEKLVHPIIQDLAKQAKETGVPIIRPLWWLDPTDPITFDISDQFLVGDSLLVAPILYEGTYQRNIYLPRVNGTWKDHLYKHNIPGPIWIKNYKVQLEQIAYFTVDP